MWSFKTYMLICAICRIVLIVYGEIRDRLSSLPYTDIDYKVVTDGARYVLKGESPFNRHTYRYSPILAYLVLPNLLIHSAYGKILFSIFDFFVGFLIKLIVELLYSQVSNWKPKVKRMAKLSCLFWLSNPFTMVIATRGSNDSISSFLVLLSLYFVIKSSNSLKTCIVAGIFHGFSIHFRLYPILFSLPYFFSLSSYKNDKSLVKAFLQPNSKQLLFTITTIVTFFAFTYLFYTIYGYKYLFESTLYHMMRKDTRHNFSLYFYMQYLFSEEIFHIITKLLMVFPQLLITIYVTYKFGYDVRTLPFCMFLQIFTLVTYNSVVTSQYFIWFLSLLPISFKNLEKVGFKSGLAYIVVWLLSQCGWLLPAYFLEFKGWNTFEFIWLQGILFYSANIYIMQRLVINFRTFLHN